MRFDPFDPNDRTHSDDISFVNIRSAASLTSLIERLDDDNIPWAVTHDHIDMLFPKWCPIIVRFLSGWIPMNQYSLIQVISAPTSEFIALTYQSSYIGLLLNLRRGEYDSLWVREMLSSVMSSSPLTDGRAGEISMKGIIHVCDLYRINSREQNVEDELISSLIHTISWYRAVQYIRAMTRHSKNRGVNHLCQEHDAS